MSSMALHAFFSDTFVPLHPVTCSSHRGAQMGSVEDTSTGSYAYRASKAGVNIVCKALANELGPKGVTVTLLHPGYVITDMTEGRGLIDTATSVGGMLSVLEGGDDIHGKFLAWDKKVVPW